MTEAVSISKIYDELKRIEEIMVTKKDMERLLSSIEILSNPETVSQINDSTKDIQIGKTKKVTSVKDILKAHNAVDNQDY